MSEIDNEFAQRTEAALAMGGKKKVDALRTAGKLNARERIDRLLDPGTFTEVGRFAKSYRAEDAEYTPADGKVMGFGEIDGRTVAVASNDFTVKGASSSKVNSAKMKFLKETANQNGIPIFFLGESSGARIPDRMGAAGIPAAGEGPTQYQRVRRSPWFSALLGHCYGSSAWYGSMSDYSIMSEDAVMAISSPRLSSTVISESVSFADMGGHKIHTRISGLIDDVESTEEACIDRLRQAFSFFPTNCGEAPPVALGGDANSGPATQISDVLPLARKRVYDVRKILELIYDKGTIFEFKPHYGKSLVTALARLNGSPVGVIANNPLFKGGAIDVDCCNKATSFIVMCDSFNIPLVMMADHPGFIVGSDGEHRGVTGKAVNWLNALSLVTVPRVAVIMRKSYGLGLRNMGGGGNADYLLAWTTADVGFMDPKSAAAFMRPKENGEAIDDVFAEPALGTTAYDLAAPFLAQSVIPPDSTREELIRVLKVLRRGTTSGIGQHHLASWPTSFS